MSARRRARALALRDAETLESHLFPAGDYPAPFPQFRTMPPIERYLPIDSDREALRRIAEQADAITTGGMTWLLIAAPAPLLDYLEQLDAAIADDEDVGDDEP